VKNKSPVLTLGVEEELFLVDKNTGELCGDWPQPLLLHFNKYFPGQIIREYIRSQVELITKPCNDVNQLSENVITLRATAQEKCSEFGLALMAASTHPIANWRKQHPNKLLRYSELSDKLQVSARRLLTGGMHIHIGIDDTDLRLQTMNRLLVFLPLILSLSSSSPFWCGEDTGMSSYRASVLEGLPRSGFPPLFKDYQAFTNYIECLKKAKAIQNGREIWWDVRPNFRYPTLEVRIADTCSKVSDAMAIVALLQCLVHHFVHNPRDFNIEQEYSLALENRWRAQRYSLSEASLISFEHEGVLSVAEIVNGLVSELDQDARELGCLSYLRHCRKIVSHGTSSDRQRSVFQAELKRGITQEQALKAVILDLVKVSSEFKKACKVKVEMALSDSLF
jgi:glutamate---cysteine ligase / carboxylate-amine ligase